MTLEKFLDRFKFMQAKYERAALRLGNGNREVGVNIVADGRVAIGASFIGGSSFSGTTGLTTTSCPGQVGTFCGYGLQIVTPDSIDIQGVVANDNFLWGASLNAGQDVNIVDSIFNANSTNSPAFIDDTGLLITSGGNTSLNNVQANQNRLIGAVINSVGSVSIAPSPITPAPQLLEVSPHIMV